MEEQENNLEKRLLEWLNTQGYPLELEVALAFQKEGFSVSSSDWYKDYETSELREIDVTALKWSETSKQKHLQVCFRVECKTARDKPWIIFKSQAEKFEFSPLLFTATDNYKSYLLNLLLNKRFAPISKLPLIPALGAGHGITQAFTSGQDIPYKALTTVIKASVDRITMLQEFQNDGKMSKVFEFFGVVFPVIVIDGLLFECDATETKELNLRNVEYSVVHSKNRLPVSASPEIHIVTKQFLGKFLKLASDTTNGLIANFQVNNESV